MLTERVTLQPFRSTRNILQRLRIVIPTPAVRVDELEAFHDPLITLQGRQHQFLSAFWIVEPAWHPVAVDAVNDETFAAFRVFQMQARVEPTDTFRDPADISGDIDQSPIGSDADLVEARRLDLHA